MLSSLEVPADSPSVASARCTLCGIAAKSVIQSTFRRTLIGVDPDLPLLRRAGAIRVWLSAAMGPSREFGIQASQVFTWRHFWRTRPSMLPRTTPFSHSAWGEKKNKKARGSVTFRSHSWIFCCRTRPMGGPSKTKYCQGIV